MCKNKIRMVKFKDRKHDLKLILKTHVDLYWMWVLLIVNHSCIVAHERLNLHLVDIVTTYSYDSLDNDISMKLPEVFSRIILSMD